MELWLPIERHPNYEASSDGRIRNRITGRILKPGVNPNGYFIVVIPDENNIRRTRLVHRLVAETFYDHTDPSLIINHIDGDKRNNHLYNLEFCTYSENNLHAYKSGLKKPIKPYNQPASKKVKIVETGEVFESISACARHINGNRRHISDCLHGRIMSHCGYHYEYVD